MGKIHFGINHLGSDTPPAVKGFYRAIMFASMFWAMTVEPRLPNVAEHMKYLIDSWLAMGTGGVYFICQFFGWKVPTEEEMKAELKNKETGVVAELPKMEIQMPAPPAPQKQVTQPAANETVQDAQANGGTAGNVSSVGTGSGPDA